MSNTGHVLLTDGQVVFADTSLPWSPNDLPVLPSTNIAITAVGTAATRGFSTIALSNAITYEPFEPPAARSNLIKQFQITSTGSVTYAESKVSFVSTVLTAFNAPVTGFQPSSIGAPNISAYGSDTPDTITNALAKLDSWIVNAFLLQPPSVTLVNNSTTSLFAPVRWLNFNTYSLLDKAVPYVNSMVFVIGDPTSANFCSIEIKDSQYFPFRTYRDGISPNFNPIVQLRIFTDCFPPGGDVVYTKVCATSQCIRVVSEAGNLTVPSSGNVFSITNTNGIDTYTTFSVYLPNLPATYPANADIPVWVVYLNATAGDPNVFATTTSISDVGGPSAASTLTALVGTASNAALSVLRPTYSDSVHSVTDPYFSSYNVSYTFQQFATAHSSITGYRYGISTIYDKPTVLSNYVNTAIQSFKYTGSPQQTSLSNLIPGIAWSTSVVANNLAQLSGPNSAGPYVSTLYPTTVSAISSVGITNTASNITRYTASNPAYITSNNGSNWTIGAPVDTDVVFFSSFVTLPLQTTQPVQLNDVSYPGDQSTILCGLKYRTTNSTLKDMVGLELSTSAYAFTLNSNISSVNESTTIVAYITDSQTAPQYQNFFNKVSLSGTSIVSTISTGVQSFQFFLSNHTIPSFNGTIGSQILSTPSYAFRTEPDHVFQASSVQMTYITSTTQIAGLLTATTNSEVCYDVYAQNFAYRYAPSAFCSAVATLSPSNANGTATTCNAIITSSGTVLTSLPFPQDSMLTLSSLKYPITLPIYQDPTSVEDFVLSVTVNPANPYYPSAVVSNALSTFFVDTVSYGSYSNFVSTGTTYGQRIVSLLPRIESPGTATNIGDGVTSAGLSSNGLDVSISSFIIPENNNTVLISSFLTYQHTSSLQQATYTEFYARELMYTNAMYMHAAGLNFSQFNSNTYSVPFTYPNFTNDLDTDTNYGYRYATFAYEFPAYTSPTPLRYLNITVDSPSLVSSIQTTRSENNWWPDAPVVDTDVQYSKVRMHMRLTGTTYNSIYDTFETGWLNCFKMSDMFGFSDADFDAGACIAVSATSSNVSYKVMFNRRFYTKVVALVRVGIARDGSVLSGSDYPITFNGIRTTISDT